MPHGVRQTSIFTTHFITDKLCSIRTTRVLPWIGPWGGEYIPTAIAVSINICPACRFTRRLISLTHGTIKCGRARTRRVIKRVCRAKRVNNGLTSIAFQQHSNILPSTFGLTRTRITNSLIAIKCGRRPRACRNSKRVGITKRCDNGLTSIAFHQRVNNLPITDDFALLCIIIFTNYIKRVSRCIKLVSTNRQNGITAPSIPTHTHITNQLNKRITPRIGNRAKTITQHFRALSRIIYITPCTGQVARRPLCVKNIIRTPSIIWIARIIIGTLGNG